MDTGDDPLARYVRGGLLVGSIALVLLGAVGPGPVGPVTVVGIVGLVAFALLVVPIELFESTDEPAEPHPDPLTSLQERYVAGEIDEAEFERRLEERLAGGDAATPPDVDRETVTESATRSRQR